MTTTAADLLDMQAAAAYLGVSVSWLRRQHPERGGPTRYKIAGRFRFTATDLDDWVRQQREPSKTQENAWASTAAPTPRSGTSSSSTAAPNTAEARGRQAVERLRRRLAASEPTSSETPTTPPPLKLVDREQH